MLKVSDLRKVRELCFDKVAKTSTAKKELAVLFLPTGNTMCQVIMSNGRNYARLVATLTEPCAMQEFQISWNEFQRICDFFDKEIDVQVKENKIIVTEGNKKYNIACYNNDFNKKCDFKFDFNGAYEISMDKVPIMQTDKSVFCGRYAVTKDLILSTDSCFCFASKLKQNLGEGVYQFIGKFPAGTWLFNPSQRLIVSKDKAMSFTSDMATGNFPTEGLLKLKQTPLSNWFECDAETLKRCAKSCKQLDKTIEIKFEPEAIRLKTAGYEEHIACAYNHKTSRRSISFKCDYFEYFIQCADEKGKLRIYFDDNEKQGMARAENSYLTIFGMALIR